jgi:hypothetical protein
MTRKEASMIRSLACLLGLVALAALAPLAASADSDSPNYRSKLVAVTPQTRGLVVRVVDGDDQLELRNATGGNVMVPGYEGEPYLRFLKGGRVEVNVNSPAKYLNEERYGGVTVPKAASAKSAPRWQLVTQGGRYAWHEHRIHWMSTIEPPRVKESGGKTLMKVFDWNVPLKVGAERVKVEGTLWWVPSGQLEQADALIAAAVARQAPQAGPPPAAAPTTTEQAQTATSPDEEAEPVAAPAAASETGSSSSSSTALWVGLGSVALVAVAAGAYLLGRRRGDPTEQEGEVW